MSNNHEVNYISADELTAQLLNDADGVWSIIDVRDDDFGGGNFRNCHHIPKYKFVDAVNQYAKSLDNGNNIVFHCMKSQVRGPYCAQLFARHLDANSEANVFVLRGGMENYIAYWNMQKKVQPQIESLIVNYDQKYWQWY